MLGSNQRRLSRRFYSPSLLAEANAGDQRIRRPRRRARPTPSAMRPWASVSGGRVATDGAVTATDGGSGSGYPDRPHSLSPLTWYFQMPARCRLHSPGPCWAQRDQARRCATSRLALRINRGLKCPGYFGLLLGGLHQDPEQHPGRTRRELRRFGRKDHFDRLAPRITASHDASSVQRLRQRP